MTQKIKTLLILAFASLSFLSLLLPVSADAAREPSKTPADCASGKVMDNPKYKPDNEEPKKICLPLGAKPVALKDNPIVKKLNKIVDVLAGLVGVVVVGTIVLGGIQYAAAGDKAEAVSAAKQRIINGLIALLAFLFIYAFLQWLVPGGIF